MRKHNRWLKHRKDPAKRRIRDTCKPIYTLRSTWYRRPSWASCPHTLMPYEMDERYAEEFGLPVRQIIIAQRQRIREQMKPLLDEFYFISSIVTRHHG